MPGLRAGMTAEIHDHLDEALNQRLFDPGESAHVLSLAQRFMLPPFSIFNAGGGAWKQRKQMWHDYGLRSAEGRTARTFADNAGTDEVSQKILAVSNGQSIFDPVLCEIAYRWFCPPDGWVLDPFAGGSVRGIVAAACGRNYVGIDLSAEQVSANEEQAGEFVGRGVFPLYFLPEWHVGDAADMGTVLRNAGLDTTYDFIWSCPPYHDLEKYSDDPRDLSNMDWKTFARVYRDVIAEAVDRLADDRFAGFVVGEIRGKDGFYRGFVQLTIDAFEAAGAAYYNEALLISPAGTLPLRAAAQFVATRKLGRTHQTVLLFCKGDVRAATEACRDRVVEEAALLAGGRTADDLNADADADGADDDVMAHG